MAGRAFAPGILGWLVSGTVAAPLAGTHESAGGEALLLAGAAWLLLLGLIGRAVGGWLAARIGAVALTLILRLVVGFGIGFGIGVTATRQADESGRLR